MYKQDRTSEIFICSCCGSKPYYYSHHFAMMAVLFGLRKALTRLSKYCNGYILKTEGQNLHFLYLPQYPSHLIGATGGEEGER